MKFSAFIRYLKYYLSFIPFKINFFIYGVVLLLSYKLIHALKSDTNSFIALTLLMAKIALIFSAVVVTVSFFSTLICSVYFYFQKKSSGSSAIEIEMNQDAAKKDVLQIHTKIAIALKPILGFVYVKLFYDQNHSTDKYLLTGRIKKQWIPFKSGLAGSNSLALPYIKEYYFSGAMVYFEDMLNFFSFAVPAQINQSIVNPPHSILYNPTEFLPKKTEEEKIRIEQLRKVEGEYLNYKKFEDSDDVRRIVWKIFAKNKELVVRTPEIMDPFASHIYMYASFYNSFPFHLYESFCMTMLNHFKNCVWTVYDTLAKKEFEVKYVADQSIAANAQAMHQVKYNITLSNWHQDITLIDYYKPKNASILCIHSFTSEADVESLISNYEAGTTIFFVQLSKVFKSYYLLNWLMRIFFKAPTDTLSTLKSTWAIHPLKFKVQSNEQKIISLFKKHAINFEIL